PGSCHPDAKKRDEHPLQPARKRRGLQVDVMGIRHIEHGGDGVSYFAASFSARSTMLEIKNVRVSGPTPHGFGEIKPALSHTSGCTSPASLPSTRDTPTSKMAAPSLTISAVSMCGLPAAAMMISAARVSA